MKRPIGTLLFAVCAFVMAASTAARANFAVVKYGDGWCRVWVDATYKPTPGTWLWWRHRHHVHYSLATWDSGQKHLQWAISHNRCKHW